MAFRFRHFIVEDDRSTMPVGTDAMLLGSWADPGEARTVLDIGTGCGVLALMMAQRSGARVAGIDKDPASAAQAAKNFSASPWSDRLASVCAPVEEFSPSGRYDFIVSNPPYFSGSLKSPSPARTLARHETGLSLQGLAVALDRLLSPAGRFAVVLPVTAFPGFADSAGEKGFRQEKVMMVSSWRHKTPVRVLALFSKSGKGEAEQQELIIFDAPGRFTSGYLELTSEFHYF
jgi:tRNA1Val (adenine37-N6)-methyltransferase